MAGFAVKVPLVPLHTWLPLAHVEAPTAGSVLLAGVLLKLGTYGFLRLCMPLAPDASLSFGVPVLGTLAVVGIIYGADAGLRAGRHQKTGRLQFSVSHLGICMLGMFALNEAGLTGSLLQMINHGLSTGGLFLLVGMLYERYHTRQMTDYGGMAARLQLLAVAGLHLPVQRRAAGAERLLGRIAIAHGDWCPAGAKVPGAVLCGLGATGVVLGAWYLLTMLRRVFFGPYKEPHHEGRAVGDLNGASWRRCCPSACCASPWASTRSRSSAPPTAI